ncbi:GNAT family N-acetyltransferase [Microlunatus parietis]|uniref:RimJ/RimL family protein N-acetyltransferase n=1 Tax=Microlunatus parietis TaxID=682979 RepID=A0A7Y9IE88_9ACTN|nr:GNAT family protein [Microlunatus parietis]NYE75160.1 RimJ/RimL family protein N-acetyltransferase [Microlunatus parietis]
MVSPDSPWFDPVPLTGRMLRLEPLTEADADDYAAALGDPATAAEVVAHMSFLPPTSRADIVKIIAAATADPGRIAYAQRLRDTGEFVGTTSFYEITPNVRALAIGHTWIGRRHWRTGVNTDSKLIMLGRAFDELGAERVVWHTDIRNTRSQAAIERLGATKEGVLRHHRIRPDGSWRDTVQYSMLSTEWPAVRQRLEESSR